MIEILICDDDKHFCGYLESGILNWASKNQCMVNVEQCYSGNSLRQYMEKEERPYLLFLDIELGDETGMQIGEYIRDYLKDENLQIVFVSSHTHYAMELFHIRPFDFMVKPINVSQLNQILSKYREIKLCREKSYFTYHQNKYAHRIELDDIMYFQSDRKKIKIVTESRLLSWKESQDDAKKLIEYYGNLEDAVKQLDKKQFWSIHKSYIVNVNYVKSFGRMNFLLKHDIEIPVSRSRWRDVQQRILLYGDI